MASAEAIDQAAGAVNFSNIKGPGEFGVHMSNILLRGAVAVQDLRENNAAANQQHIFGHLSSSAGENWVPRAGPDTEQALAIRGVAQADLARQMADLQAIVANGMSQLASAVSLVRQALPPVQVAGSGAGGDV